jgi:predicted PurR-regulated permease PerM
MWPARDCIPSMNPMFRLTSAGTHRPDSLVRATVVVLGVALAFLVPLFLFGYAAKALMLAFGGVLFAVFLRMLSALVLRLVTVSEGSALAVAIALLIVVTTLAGMWMAPRVSGELGQLADQLPKSFDHLIQQAEQYPGGAWIASASRTVPSNGQKAIKAGEYLAALALEGAASLVIVLFLGIYFAAHPRRYLDGLVRLLPIDRRPPVRNAMVNAGHSLERWLFGRLLAITFVGIATGVALALLGIPLALTLGLLAGLFGFIPYIGPAVSAVPAFLIALEPQGAHAALWIFLLYLGVQTVQDYVLTPLIQERTVSLPPVLTIMSQVFAAAWIGAIGVTLATPLAVVLMVLVQKLYIEDYLGDRGQDWR